MLSPESHTVEKDSEEGTQSPEALTPEGWISHLRAHPTRAGRQLPEILESCPPTSQQSKKNGQAAPSTCTPET